VLNALNIAGLFDDFGVRNLLQLPRLAWRVR
jgi:hypothetical protein